MKVDVLEVHNGDSIIQLVIKPSKELLALQRLAVEKVPGQTPFAELHITLCACVPIAELPVPPSEVELSSIVECVEREDKTSCYVRVSEKSQRELEAYVEQIQSLCENVDIKTPGRVFHASLTNLLGTPKASIAKVWDHAFSTVAP